MFTFNGSVVQSMKKVSSFVKPSVENPKTLHFSNINDKKSRKA